MSIGCAPGVSLGDKCTLKHGDFCRNSSPISQQTFQSHRSENPMSHTIRWTLEKIAQRLLLIQPRARRRRAPLAPFRYRPLAGPLEAPPVAVAVDDSVWPLIAPDEEW